MSAGSDDHELGPLGDFVPGGVGAWPAPPTTTETRLFGPADLAGVRHIATPGAVNTGLDSDRCFDVITAVNEAATNAIEHGGGQAALRIRNSDTWLDIEVTSPDGRITDALAGYLPPDPRGVRGRGLWLIRQLTDVVEIRDASRRHRPHARAHLTTGWASPPAGRDLLRYLDPHA